MKQLSSFMVLNINGGDRVTYTYDEINEDTGEPISQNNKRSFYIVDESLRTSVNAIRTYIRENKLGD